MFRTLIRFERVGKRLALARIPAWNPDRSVVIHLDQMPKKLRKQACDGFRCHAAANLRAESPLDLNIGQWE